MSKQVVKKNQTVCPNCDETVIAGARTCSACETDVGFPNVRSASHKDESDALEQRLQDALISTSSRSCEQQLKSFGESVLKSKAVICRSLLQVRNLIEDPNSVYASFYKQIGGARIPEDNYWDQGRESVDALVFPHYYENILFGSLSLDKSGITSYGGICLFLKEKMIIQRATVFEENPFDFCEKHRIIAGTQIPLGYRATWATRDKLAMAKLHGYVNSSTKSEDHPGILRKESDESDEIGFIEVHIFGTFNNKAIELITYQKPKKRPDIAIYRSFETKLNKMGIPFEAI